MSHPAPASATAAAPSGPRILWIAYLAPGARASGSPVYSGGLVEALARAGARITYLGLRNPDGDGVASGPYGERVVPGLAWTVVDAPLPSVVRALTSPLPVAAARASPPAMRAALRAALAGEAFDAVVFDNYVAGWALDAVLAAQGGARRLYIAHNDEARLAADIFADYAGNPLRKLALGANAHKIRTVEGRLLRAADVLVTLTEADRDSLSRVRPVPDRLVLPPGYDGPRLAERRFDAATPRRAVMFGSMRWIAKQMNVAAFLTRADARFAEAGIELQLIGDAPAAFRAEWEPRLRATRFLGFVDDAGEAFAAARVGVVPEATGGGFKLKTLDYLFRRLPVIALEGACAGLPAAVRRHILACRDLDDLTGAVIRTIDDLPRLDAMQRGAQAAAETAFDWDRNGRRLLDTLSKPTREEHRAA